MRNFIRCFIGVVLLILGGPFARVDAQEQDACAAAIAAAEAVYNVFYLFIDLTNFFDKYSYWINPMRLE